MDANNKYIGIVGMPPMEVIRELTKNTIKIHDLDTPALILRLFGLT
jgi:hypothetical protein